MGAWSTGSTGNSCNGNITTDGSKTGAVFEAVCKIVGGLISPDKIKNEEGKGIQLNKGAMHLARMGACMIVPGFLYVVVAKHLYDNAGEMKNSFEKALNPNYTPKFNDLPTKIQEMISEKCDKSGIDTNDKGEPTNSDLIKVAKDELCFGFQKITIELKDDNGDVLSKFDYAEKTGALKGFAQSFNNDNVVKQLNEKLGDCLDKKDDIHNNVNNIISSSVTPNFDSDFTKSINRIVDDVQCGKIRNPQTLERSFDKMEDKFGKLMETSDIQDIREHLSDYLDVNNDMRILTQAKKQCLN
jgi:hypothetical protein